MTPWAGRCIAMGLSLVAGFYAGEWHAEQQMAPPLDRAPHGLEKVLAAVFPDSDQSSELGPAEDIEQWTIERLNQFWSMELADDYQPIPFEPYDSDQRQWPPDRCGLSRNELTLNALFCGSGGSAGEPFILADRAFYAHYRSDSDTTEVSAITVLAHEWGHYASYLMGDDWAVSLREELQADCFAGMFVNWLAETRGVSNLAVERGAEVLFEIGDESPTRWTAPGRHGTPEQRLQAFRDGQMAQLHGNDLVECELYQRYRGVTQGLGDGLELLLPPTSHVEYNEEKDKFEVVAPGQVQIEVALRSIAPSQTPAEALEELRPRWFSGSKVEYVGEDSTSQLALNLYDQRHPDFGSLHGTLLVLPVQDDATRLIVVDRYETGPAPEVDSNQDAWRELVDSAYAYARSVEPIG